MVIDMSEAGRWLKAVFVGWALPRPYAHIAAYVEKHAGIAGGLIESWILYAYRENNK